MIEAGGSSSSSTMISDSLAKRSNRFARMCLRGLAAVAQWLDSKELVNGMMSVDIPSRPHYIEQ